MIILSTKQKPVPVGTPVFGSLQQWYYRAGGDQGEGVPGSGRFGAGMVGSSLPVP